MIYILVLCLVLVICNAFPSFNVNNEVIEPEEHRYDQNRTIWPGMKHHYPFIVGGSIAFPGEEPWYVSLEGMSICGGSILNKRTVISAAHCFIGQDLQKPTVSVRYGSRQLYSGGTVVQATRIIQHPMYVATGVDYDIALLILKTDIEMNGNTVKAVRLPEPDSDPEAGTYVVVAGLGQTDDFGTLSTFLKDIVLQIADQKKCKKSYKGAGDITARMICTQPQGGDGPCKGDSGGALTINGTNTQVGIVSFSRFGCADRNYPFVYARVSAFLDFINKNKA